MSNIQQSLNSVLTSGAELKAFGARKELKKALDKASQQKREYKEQTELNESYINSLLGQKTTGKIKPTEEVKALKGKTIGKRSIMNYNVNEEFNIAEESARSFLDELVGSFYSFMGNYDDRKSNGGK